MGIDGAPIVFICTVFGPIKFMDEVSILPNFFVSSFQFTWFIVFVVIAFALKYVPVTVLNVAGKNSRDLVVFQAKDDDTLQHGNSDAKSFVLMAALLFNLVRTAQSFSLSSLVIS